MSRKAAISPQLQAFQPCRKAPCEGDHKPDVLAYLVLNSRDVRTQRVEHGGLSGSVVGAEPVARLSDGVQLGITISIDLGNYLSALELAHDRGRVREESALVHLHGVQAERTASVLGHGEGLICEVHGALHEAVVADVSCSCRAAPGLRGCLLRPTPYILLIPLLVVQFPGLYVLEVVVRVYRDGGAPAVRVQRREVHPGLLLRQLEPLPIQTSADIAGALPEACHVFVFLEAARLVCVQLRSIVDMAALRPDKPQGAGAEVCQVCDLLDVSFAKLMTVLFMLQSGHSPYHYDII